MNQRCDECRFWEPNTTWLSTSGKPLQGFCKRYPPTAVWISYVEVDVNATDPPGESGMMHTEFPTLDAGDWCGEFQPIEKSELSAKSESGRK